MIAEEETEGSVFSRSGDRFSGGATSRLLELVGREQRLEEVTRALRTFVQELRAPAVGAMHLTCSDESEHECIEDFQRNFVRYLLPSRKPSSRSAFASATLGGRYQWGAAAIAEDHFALARGADQWKVMLIKPNAHVAVAKEAGGQTFGSMQRYEGDSTHCGALAAVLAGATLPFVLELTADLGMEGVDRVATLNDPDRVDPAFRSLFVAIASARLQARRILIDLQEHDSVSPTLYIVAPCVTLNRRDHDTEILVGLYACDDRHGAQVAEYTGLGDRPEDYRFSLVSGMIRVGDGEVGRVRAARDHRAEVLAAWRARGLTPDADGWPPELRVRLESLARERPHDKHGPVAKAALTTLLAAALEFAPVPAAVVLFGTGIVGIHHAVAAHRLAREADQDHVARAMLDGMRGSVDELSPEQARHLTELLLQEYGHRSG